ncbi:MAG TPA: DUF5050 domain-containing protein [Candidatus Saccharimonadales bacterium]|nr:DUF5050 domain-containing protein [Candidatus Saccharimonadales bacterium]
MAVTASTILPAKASTTQTKYLNGKIAFDSDRSDGNPEIYTANADGSDLTRLTNDSGFDYNPAWSPDGTKIAFYSNRTGNYEIYTMNADGSNQTRLTNNSAQDENPAWLPDGTKLVFVSQRDGNREIYVMNADGSNPARLTNAAGFDYSPAWSPDGTKISFNSDRDSTYQIYTMNADGSNPTKITNGASSKGYASWSPDGNKIAFYGDTGASTDIFVANTDGSNPINITNSVTQEDSTAFSPDGKKIVSTIYSANYSRGDVYSMNIDGTGLTQLASGGSFSESYSSQPFQPLPYTLTANDDGTTTSTISSDKDYSNTDYTVANNETLILDGKLGNVTVQSGGTLEGTGTVTGTLTVNSGGNLSPGHSPGCLSSGNLTLSGTYTVQIAGTTACTDYDQTQVTGTVNLNNATLSLSLLNGFSPKAGDSFTIIDNDGTDAVTGTFNNLPEGSALTLSGHIFRVSYVGGTGNDVVLTALNVPGAPNTGGGAAASSLLLIVGLISTALGTAAASRRFMRHGL